MSVLGLQNCNTVYDLVPAVRVCVQGLLVREPASRLTANQALEHPWIKDQRSAPSKSLNGSVVRLHTPASQLLVPAGWLPICAGLVLCCVVLCSVVLGHVVLCCVV